MQDEISAARRKKRRKYQLRRATGFLIALIVIVAAVFIADSVSKTTIADIGDFIAVFFKQGSYPSPLGSTSVLDAERISMAYAAITEDELIVRSSNGAAVMDVQHRFLNPCMAARGNRILVYDGGNRSFAVYNRSKLLTEQKTEYVIIDGSVGRGGTVALLTESERYSCQLEIFENGRYNNTMTWYGSGGFPFAVQVRDDGRRVAVARMLVSGGKLQTMLTVLDINTKKEVYESIVDGLAIKMIFDGDNMVVVTAETVYALDASGQVKKTYELPTMLVLAVTSDKGPVVISMGDNLLVSVNRAIVLDRALNEMAVIENAGMVRDQYISGNRLYILGNHRISEYSLRGELLARYKVGADAFHILDINGLVVLEQQYAVRITRDQKEEP